MGVLSNIEGWFTGEAKTHPHVAAVVSWLEDKAAAVESGSLGAEIGDIAAKAKAALTSYGLPYLQSVLQGWLTAHGIPITFPNLSTLTVAQVKEMAAHLESAVAVHGEAYVEHLVEPFLAAHGLPVSLPTTAAKPASPAAGAPKTVQSAPVAPMKAAAAPPK